MNRNNIIFMSSLGFDINKIQKIIDYNIDLCKISSTDLYGLNFLSNEDVKLIIKNRNSHYYNDFQEKIKESKIKIYTIFDKDYPYNLRNIIKAPLILYTKGKIYKNEFQIAVIGSRTPSPYGRWACKEISNIIARRNICIVSGLARGIDRYAHKNALDNNRRTVGVLGSGIDIIYPKENKDIYYKMMDKGGIISEFPMGTKPFAYNFPRRNRIISALSQIVIVIEAKERSGTMITTNYALEQGKDILSLCGNINNELSKGTNSLIKKGAYPITSLEDLDEYLDTFVLTKVDV